MSTTVGEDDYLRAEEVREGKAEYEDGRVLAMSGVSDAHNRITLNLVILMNRHLDGGPCRPYFQALKVHIEEASCYYYPDIFVTCDEGDRRLAYFKEHPSVAMEVLSPSNEQRDRGKKFLNYQKIASLEEYVLVSQDRMQVEVFRRDGEGRWIYRPLGEGDELVLPSIDLRCAIEDLYRGVDFQTAATSPDEQPR